MKLICSQAEFNSALQLVSRAVASRPTHPVLANVLITADAGTNRLSLTGFDLNLGIQTSCAASVEVSGATTLPARLLGEIVSRLSSDSPITLSSDDSGQQIELISQSGTYQMRGMPSDDFPDLPMVESGTSLKVNGNALVKALRSTLFASSSDEAKQLLTGVHLSFDGKAMKAAATDGHRLAILDIDDALETEFSIDSENLDNEKTFAVTLPARSLKEVERLVSSAKNNEFINLFCDRGQVVFLANDQVITTRTLEGKYPNYSQLIPESFSQLIEVDKFNLISALERVAVLADQHNNVVKLKTDKESQCVEIFADAQDVGSGSETVSAKFESESIQIAFNARYLLDGLKALEGNSIVLQCNAPTTPAVFSPLDNNIGFLYLVMPVQIRSEN